MVIISLLKISVMIIYHISLISENDIYPPEEDIIEKATILEKYKELLLRMIEVKSKEEAIETTSNTWRCYRCGLIFYEEW
jgi:hypothetical protein